MLPALPPPSGAGSKDAQGTPEPAADFIRSAPLQGHCALPGFTPLVKLGSLGADSQARLLGATPSAQPTQLFGPSTVLSEEGQLAGGGSTLKGSSLMACTPFMLPITFVPVPLPTKQHPPTAGGSSGGKLRPGGPPPSPNLRHAGSFSIPAFGRAMTQLDFISTGAAGRGRALHYSN